MTLLLFIAGFFYSFFSFPDTLQKIYPSFRLLEGFLQWRLFFMDEKTVFSGSSVVAHPLFRSLFVLIVAPFLWTFYSLFLLVVNFLSFNGLYLLMATSFFQDHPSLFNFFTLKHSFLPSAPHPFFWVFAYFFCTVFYFAVWHPNRLTFSTYFTSWFRISASLKQPAHFQSVRLFFRWGLSWFEYQALTQLYSTQTYRPWIHYWLHIQIFQDFDQKSRQRLEWMDTSDYALISGEDSESPLRYPRTLIQTLTDSISIPADEELPLSFPPHYRPDFYHNFQRFDILNWSDVPFFLNHRLQSQASFLARIQEYQTLHSTLQPSFFSLVWTSARRFIQRLFVKNVPKTLDSSKTKPPSSPRRL